MKLEICAGLSALLVMTSCSPPVQRGGLGVFNPNGFAGRIALAERVNGSPAVGVVEQPQKDVRPPH